MHHCKLHSTRQKNALIKQAAPNHQLRCSKYAHAEGMRKSALIRRYGDSRSNLKMWFERKERLCVRKLTYKELLSFFLQHRRSKEKHKAYIRRQKLWLKCARRLLVFPNPNLRVTESDFLRATRPQPRVCVLHHSANFGDSVERISSHARTRKPLSPSRILKPCAPAGRRERGGGV